MFPHLLITFLANPPLQLYFVICLRKKHIKTHVLTIFKPLVYLHCRQIGRDPFFKVPNLEYLNLAGNQIDKLNLLAFTTLTKLTQLDLSKNRILDIPLGVFEALANLSHLDLSYNSLSVLDAGTTFGLARLSYLDLKSNDIIRINASSLAFCHSLTTLTLSGKIGTRKESGRLMKAREFH